MILLIISFLSSAAWATAIDCTAQLQDLRHAFIGPTVMLNTSLGPLELGVVDVEVSGVSEAISTLLVRSISDARESNQPPGHLPDHLVDDVIRQYVSPEKVRTLWSAHGFRFALMNELGEIIGSVLLGSDHRVILYVSRWANNVPTEEYPGLKPEGYHHMMNLSVKHELRRARIGTLMMDAIMQNYRSLFNGRGIWMRADPPWHDKLAGLGFVHDPSMDSFLPAASERTLNLPHADYNQKYACHCEAPFPAKPRALAERAGHMAHAKIQYFSFTRDFAPAERLAEKSHLLWQRLNLKTETYDVLIIGAGPVGTALALQLKSHAPAQKVLVVEKGLSAFAMAGHGRLYPLNLPSDFSFPGGDVQPLTYFGRHTPGGIEDALLGNQINLDLLLNTQVTGVNVDGKVDLSNGLHVNARKIVVAIGAGEPDYQMLDMPVRRFLDQQTRVQDFPTFARDQMVARHTHLTSPRPQTVAVIGDGAAARAAVRLISENRREFKPAIQVQSGDMAESVTYEPATDHFMVRTAKTIYPVDRVILALGFKNQTQTVTQTILREPIRRWTDVVSSKSSRVLARRAEWTSAVDVFTIGAAQQWDGRQKSLAELFEDVVEFTQTLGANP